MEMQIKPLSPELAETFAQYLDNLNFDHSPHWATCYCRFYQTSCTAEQWRGRTGAENRAEAVEQIRAGAMKGYLAFHEGKCIGWCNANDAKAYIRLEQDIRHIVEGKKAGCVICFVIHPEYRGKGVARLLLREAVENFKSQGFEMVISMPVQMSDNAQKSYRGTQNMYKEMDFKEIEKDDSVSIMCLQL